VLDHERPTLLVTRDDVWCFLCGGEDHEQSTKDFKGVCLEHIIEQDATLLALLGDLEPGWEAERTSVNSTWRRSRTPPDVD
jgi:hypothetical protein